MYSRTIVAFTIFVILCLALVGATKTAAWQDSPRSRLLPKTEDGEALTDTLDLSWDEQGDLWVRGPHYVWNITSGHAITTFVNGSEYAWRTLEAPDRRVVDNLFIVQDSNTPITAQIFFALPDEALVYLEREVGESVEGLEIAFRSSDGLLRLTHRWQGASPPTHLAASGSVLSGQANLNESRGERGDSGTSANGGYTYSTRFDPRAHAGYALLNKQSPPPPPPDSRVLPCTPDSVNSQLDTAFNRCRFPDFYLPGQAIGTAYLFFYDADSSVPEQPVTDLIDRLQLAMPDLDAAYIMRTPRYAYDASKNGPKPGDTVTFQAKVANPGDLATGPFEYIWFIDDLPMQVESYPDLAPGAAITLTLNWAWQDGVHKVRLELDPDNTIAEVSELNNRVDDRTNGLAVGFWVEQSLYEWVSQRQVELGLGSVSWEDWAQRQLRVWNQMLATAIHPLTPEGVIDRLRLDKVTIVADGSIANGNAPDPNDKTVDLMWGFLSDAVTPPDGWYLLDPSPMYVEWSLLHEMSHARYLMDLYGLNVAVHAIRLSTGVDSSATTLTAPGGDWWPLPAYLAVERELIVCGAYSSNSFTECTRGAEGTLPRPHPANAVVNMAMVRLQDGAGNLVQGGPDLPLTTDYYNHLYYNLGGGTGGDDLMNGGRKYEQHSAYAWNRIAGQRPVCGNYNAPCNLGEYINDLPEQNVFVLRGENDQPLVGAQVELYRRKSFPGLYMKLYQAPPDATAVSDGEGRVVFGRDIFGDERLWTADGVCLLKITANGKTYYRFFEVTIPNEQYWAGARDTGSYVIKLGLTISNKAPAVVVTGSPITYTITVKNAGNAAVSNLVIRSTLPEDATYVSGGQRVGNEVTWSLSDLPAAASHTVQFVVSAARTITNSQYSVSASGGANARGNQAIVTEVIAPLQISKSAPRSVRIGNPITYTLMVRNRGSRSVTNLGIIDTVPNGATYLAGGTHAGNAVMWTAPSLSAGDIRIAQFSVSATQTITNSDYYASADGGLLTRGTQPIVVIPHFPVTRLTIQGPVTGTLGTLQQFTVSAEPSTATLPIDYVWQTGGRADIVHSGGLTDSVSLSWDEPGVKVVTVKATFSDPPVVASHPITVFHPPALVVIDSVDPMPPYCVLRNSSDPADRTLRLTGGPFPLSGGQGLQFRKVSTGETSIRFGMEVNWENPELVSVDMARIKHLLWSDRKLVLAVRVTVPGPPVSDWSSEFILADDASACGAVRPTATPTQTPTSSVTPTPSITPTPTPTVTPSQTPTPSVTPTRTVTPTPFNTIIRAVEPSPPYCVLRSSPDLFYRQLQIRGDNLPVSEPRSLQFRNVGTGQTSIHFGMEVNWASATYVSIDMARIKHLLWQDRRVVLSVRLVGASYAPLSDWSSEFILADDAEACGAVPPRHAIFLPLLLR